LIVHIDNLKIRSEIRIGKASSRSERQDDKLPRVHPNQTSRDSSEAQGDKVREECEEFVRDSKRLREIALCKRAGKSKT
jgi:hypothetical protein